MRKSGASGFWQMMLRPAWAACSTSERCEAGAVVVHADQELRQGLIHARTGRRQRERGAVVVEEPAAATVGDCDCATVTRVTFEGVFGKAANARSSRGTSRLTSLRLFSRAPRTRTNPLCSRFMRLRHQTEVFIRVRSSGGSSNAKAHEGDAKVAKEW